MSVEELDSDAGPAARPPPDVSAPFDADDVVALDGHDPSRVDDPPVRPLTDRLRAVKGRGPLVVGSVAFLSLALGVLIGTEVTSDRRDAEADAARLSRVDLVAVARYSADGNYGRNVGDTGAPVQLDGGLDLVNAGPLPVTVTAVGGVAAGLTTKPITSEVELVPGRKATFVLQARVDCGTYRNATDVRYAATVRSSDGRERAVDLSVVQTGGSLMFDRVACEPAPQYVNFAGNYIGMSPRRADGTVTLRMFVTPAFEDPARRVPTTVSSVSLPWADSARLEAPEGTVTIPLAGAEVRVLVTVSRCNLVKGQTVDGYLDLGVAQAGSDQPGTVGSVSFGARYQRDALQLVSGVCGPDLGESRVPG